MIDEEEQEFREFSKERVEAIEEGLEPIIAQKEAEKEAERAEEMAKAMEEVEEEAKKKERARAEREAIQAAEVQDTREPVTLALPQLISEPVAEPPPKDELADLFEVPQPEDNDITTEHLTAVPEKEDLSDLFNVSEEEMMGGDSDLSDLVDVSTADVMGDDEPEPEGELMNDEELGLVPGAATNYRRKRGTPRSRRIGYPQRNPSTMRGMRY